MALAAAARTYNLLIAIFLLFSSAVRADVEVITTAGGNITIIDSVTRSVIPQGDATDGAGRGFSAPAIIWILFCFLFGVPMALAGIRGWKLTTGVGMGVSAGVISWAAIINSVKEEGVSDLTLTAIVSAFIFLGFCLGLFEFVRTGATILVVLSGGLSYGIRIVLIKDSLLVSSSYVANWAIAGIIGLLPGILMIWVRRPPLLFGCVAIGTFFTFLGVDLIMSQQDGLSRGLRFLFDRNTNHLADIISNGYHPSLTTRINTYVSLGSTPILAYVQHRIFQQPFIRNKQPDAELSVNLPTDMTDDRKFSPYNSVQDGNSGNNLLVSRFSL